MEYNENCPKQVIIIRKDLNMRKGKMIAQGAHASLKAIFNLMCLYKFCDLSAGENLYFGEELVVKTGSALDQWINGIFKKIVLGSNSLNELVEAYNEAKKLGIPCSLIEDAGLTEFGGVPTITACAIGPDFPEKIDPITKKFSLL